MSIQLPPLYTSFPYHAISPSEVTNYASAVAVTVAVTVSFSFTVSVTVTDTVSLPPDPPFGTGMIVNTSPEPPLPPADVS